MNTKTLREKLEAALLDPVGMPLDDRCRELLGNIATRLTVLEGIEQRAAEVKKKGDAVWRNGGPDWTSMLDDASDYIMGNRPDFVLIGVYADMMKERRKKRGPR